MKEPSTIVRSVSITAGKQSVHVPLSAFSDLANAEEVAVQPTKNGYMLVIKGGEASTAYQAELEFDGEFLLRRKVFHREFPTVAWEETTYSFNRGL